MNAAPVYSPRRPVVGINMQWNRHFIDFKEPSLQPLEEKFPSVDFVNLSPADERARETIGRADAFLTWQWPMKGFENIRPERMRWVQLAVSGVSKSVIEAATTYGFMVTNARGVTASPIADYCMAWMQVFERKLDEAMSHQFKRHYGAEMNAGSPSGFRGLAGKTVGIVGTGEIGQAVAERASVAGMKVIGVRKNAGEIPPHVSQIFPEPSAEFLGQADYVVVSVPSTSDTHHMVNARFTERMKPDAHLISVSNDGVVDLQAVTDAVREGKIAGAAVEMTAPPKPEDPWHDALFGTPKFYFTPSIAHMTPNYTPRVVDLFARNMQHFLAGEPLENKVEVSRGY